MLTDIDAVLADYGTLTVTRYDLATADGQAFAERNAVEHPFLTILIDGERTFDPAGRMISLNDFPRGRGTDEVPDGDWTLDDLRAILDQVIADDEPDGDLHSANRRLAP